MRSAGLGVVLPTGLSGTLPTAEGLQTRATAFHDMLLDPTIDALIATGGGKSTGALLPMVDYGLVRRAAKPVMGFSDVTALLNAIVAQSRLVTFYGPNVLSKLNESGHFALQELKSLLPLPRRTDPKAATLAPGIGEGRLVGGNLSTFAISNADTIYEPRDGPSILLWEAGSRDWGKVAQHLSALRARHMHLRMAGMIVGKIGTSPSITTDELKVLTDLIAPFRVPTLYFPNFGHGKADNPLWPLGGRVRLNATEKWIDFHDPMVRVLS